MPVTMPMALSVDHSLKQGLFLDPFLVQHSSCMSVCLLGYHAIAGEAMAAPLFKPFRALGYITDEVPFAVQRRGKETYVTVSVGKSWQVRAISAA
jgi:hypothetical protein